MEGNLGSIIVKELVTVQRADREWCQAIKPLQGPTPFSEAPPPNGSTIFQSIPATEDQVVKHMSLCGHSIFKVQYNPITPVVRRLMENNHKFKTSLDYTVRFTLKRLNKHAPSLPSSWWVVLDRSTWRAFSTRPQSTVFLRLHRRVSSQTLAPTLTLEQATKTL